MGSNTAGRAALVLLLAVAAAAARPAGVLQLAGGGQGRGDLAHGLHGVALGAMAWRPCDDTARPMMLDAVALTPDPPVIGSPAIFAIDVTSGACACV
jgi:hypothetical protein